jgi:hypothetical protein
MELDALMERCGRIRDERARVMDRLSQLQHQQREQAQYDTLGQTLDEFCRKMNDVLDNPSFETKQRILRLVVDKILVRDEEITIQHTVPISDVRLWRDHYPEHSAPSKARRCQPGVEPGPGSLGQAPGTECCVASGNAGGEAYTGR